MIVIIEHNVSDAAVARVQEFLDETSLRDVDFNGVEFEIERGDSTEIDPGNLDAYDVARLYSAVQRAIEGSDT